MSTQLAERNGEFVMGRKARIDMAVEELALMIDRFKLVGMIPESFIVTVTRHWAVPGENTTHLRNAVVHRWNHRQRNRKSNI